MNSDYKPVVWVICFIATLALPVLWGEFQPKDTATDWVILQAGLEGLDISQPVRDLAVELDVPGYYPPEAVARPPGFFALYLPGLASQTGLMVAIAVLNAVSVAYLSRGSVWVMFGLLLIVSEMLMWLNPVAIWAALIARTWNHLDETDWRWGIPLGMAAAVRLWPLLPVVFLLLIRRKLGWGALGAFTALTAFGVAIIGFDDVVGSMVSGAEWMTYPGQRNISLSALGYRLGIPVILTVAVGSIMTLALTRRMSPFWGYGVAVLGAILLSPLGWPGYLASTAPAWKAWRHKAPPSLSRPQGG